MFKWIRKSPSEPLPISMSDVRLGDRLLVVGCSDPRLIAALAAKAGLTGRACAVDAHDARSREAGRVAEAEGVLLETASSPSSALPYPDDSFDVVVMRGSEQSAGAETTAALSEARRVVRPGGRCVAIYGVHRSGLGGVLRGRRAETPQPDDVVRAFRAAGFLAVRPLAEREGQLFVEGVKRSL